MQRNASSLLKVLEEAQKAFPSLRTVQLIINALPEGIDPYYVEDDRLILLINDYIQKYGPLCQVCHAQRVPCPGGICIQCAESFF